MESSNLNSFFIVKLKICAPNIRVSHESDCIFHWAPIYSLISTRIAIIFCNVWNILLTFFKLRAIVEVEKFVFISEEY